jgi:hypothetical protein
MRRSERGSRWLSGSSRTRRGGWWRSAATTRTFWRVPFDREAIGSSNSSVRRNAVTKSRVRSVARWGSSRRTPETNSRNSWGVRASYNIDVSGTYPIRAFVASASFWESNPKTRMVPPAGRTSPTIDLIVLDLPAPFEPKRP